VVAQKMSMRGGRQFSYFGVIVGTPGNTLHYKVLGNTKLKIALFLIILSPKVPRCFISFSQRDHVLAQKSRIPEYPLF
jgi:hypothetical protein